MLLHVRDEQGTSSRPPRGVHTTLLIRAKLPGSWHRHRRQCHWDLLKSKKALAHPKLWPSRQIIGTSLSVDCQYGQCSKSLTSS